jgi:hypothetical protein
MKKSITLLVAVVALLCGCRNTGNNRQVDPSRKGEELSVEEDMDFYDDYTWDEISFRDCISVMYDQADYACKIIDRSDDEVVFRLEPTWEEADGAFALIRFTMADRALETDSDAWEESLQDALDPMMTALEEDGDFEMDGRFSPWYELETDFGEYIQYMGTRVSSDKYVQGVFAARGSAKDRALIQAEAPDEEVLMILLDLFETVSFDF